MQNINGIKRLNSVSEIIARTTQTTPASTINNTLKGQHVSTECSIRNKSTKVSPKIEEGNKLTKISPKIEDGNESMKISSKIPSKISSKIDDGKMHVRSMDRRNHTFKLILIVLIPTVSLLAMSINSFTASIKLYMVS